MHEGREQRKGERENGAWTDRRRRRRRKNSEETEKKKKKGGPNGANIQLVSQSESRRRSASKVADRLPLPPPE